MTLREAVRVARDPRADAYDELEALEILQDCLDTYYTVMTPSQALYVQGLIEKLRKSVTEDLGGI